MIRRSVQKLLSVLLLVLLGVLPLTLAQDDDSAPPDDSGSKPEGTLKGLTYVMRTGATPDRLVFSTDSAGIESGDDVNDDEPNAFTYTYTSTGDTTAALVVQFKADKWDEYDLTFVAGNTGAFVRREFDDGVLDDTDTGAFVGTMTP